MFLNRCIVSYLRPIPNHYRLCSKTKHAGEKFLHRSQVVKFSSAKSGGNPSGFQKYKSVIAAVAVAATGTIAYVYTSQRSKRDETLPVVEEELEAEVKFVDEHLDENLELLEKFGPVPYLLIGGGAASFAAFRAIRAKEENAKILILTEEAFYPYMRPPLSKEMWFDNTDNPAKTLIFKQWNGKERSIYFEPQDFYCSVKDLLENKNGGVAVIRGVKVVNLDPTRQVVYLHNGKTISYEKCLLAIGGKPKNLPIFEASDDLRKHVTLFRNIQDFRKLYKISKTAKSITIVGGGFLGSELACALGKRSEGSDLKVTQIFPENGNMGKVLPDYLCEWATAKVRSLGVDVIPKVTVDKVSTKEKKVELLLSNGKNIVTDHVVVAVGLQPNTEFADASGLEVDGKQGGFLVNAELEARKNLWIAGDAASFYDVKLGRRRVEHHDHAVVSGRLAGKNMTGAGKPYWHQSMFWSDLGPEIGYEAIGIIDSSLETVGVFSKGTEKDTPKSAVEATGEGIRSEVEEAKTAKAEQFENIVPRPPKSGDNFNKGIVFYLRDKTVVGILLWNVFGKIPIARKVLNEAKPDDNLTEVAKVFNMNEEETS